MIIKYTPSPEAATTYPTLQPGVLLSTEPLEGAIQIDQATATQMLSSGQFQQLPPPKKKGDGAE